MASWPSRALVAGVVLAQAATAFAIWQFADPGPIPLHFDWEGQADRFGDRREPAAAVAAMAALSAFGVAGLRRLGRRTSAAEPWARPVGATILLAVTSLTGALMAALAFRLIGPGETIGAATMAVVSAALAISGGFLGKVGPNPLVGVRTPWSRASRLAWDKSNRLAGRLFFWGGLIGLVAAPLVPQPVGMQATVAGALIIAAVVVVESWRVWRADPDRRSAF